MLCDACWSWTAGVEYNVEVNDSLSLVLLNS